MCYYDEVRWTCGWRWRYFRQECKSQQLIHVMCDQEFIHETWAYPDVCGLCHDTEAKQRQYDKMFRDVQQWQRDGDRSAMIGEISSKMQDLKQEIFWMKGDHERKLRSFRDEEDAFAVIPSIRFPVEYPIPLRDDTLPASAASSNPNSTSNPLVSRPLVSRPLVRSPSPRNFPMPGDVQTAIITSSSHADHGRVITDDPPTTRNKSSGASRDAESSTTKSTANTTSINADKVCLICQRKHLNCNGVKPCTSCINLNTLCIYKKTRKPKTDDVEGAGADLNTSALSSATGLDRQTGSKESLLQYTVEHNSLSTVNDTENVGNTKGDYEKTWHTTHSRSPIHSCPDMMGHCVQLSADRNLEMVSDDLSGFAKNASTRKQDASILNCLDMLSVSDPKHTANERSPRNLSSMDTSHNKNGTCRELEMSAPSTLNVNPGAHHDFGNASEDGFDNISTCSMSEGSGVISVTESTVSQSSSGSAACLSAVVASRKEMIIQHIIRLCKAWFERRLDFFARQCNGDGQSTNSGRMSSLQQASQSEQAIFGIGTCQRPNRPDDELGEDGDGHENGVPDLLETESSSRKFACPFLKYNPEKYRDCRGCILGGWLTVHRVKEHVYRKHRLPKFKCGRCCQDFRTSTQLLDHQRADDPCVLKTEEAQDGINEDQFQALRSRKRPRGGLSEEEKWIGVYKIIFPDEDLVPSPYHDFTFEQLGERRGSDSNSAAFVRDLGDHARRELPRLMRPRLESMLDQVIEESLTPDRIVELAQGIFQQILQTFNEAQATPNPQESNEDEAEHISLEAVDTQGIDHIHIAEDYPSLGLSSGIGFGLLGDQQNMLDGIFLDSVKDSFESYGLHF